MTDIGDDATRLLQHLEHDPMRPWPAPLTAKVVRALLEERTRLREALHYADDLTKDACPRCEQCGHLVMCNFHSLLSMLSGETQP
jgi:predicted metal-binding protein